MEAIQAEAAPWPRDGFHLFDASTCIFTRVCHASSNKKRHSRIVFLASTLERWSLQTLKSQRSLPWLKEINGSSKKMRDKDNTTEDSTTNYSSLND